MSRWVKASKKPKCLLTQAFDNHVITHRRKLAGDAVAYGLVHTTRLRVTLLITVAYDGPCSSPTTLTSRSEPWVGRADNTIGQTAEFDRMLWAILLEDQRAAVVKMKTAALRYAETESCFQAIEGKK